MAKLTYNISLKGLNFPAPGQKKRFPHLEKIEQDLRSSLRIGLRAGEEAMKDRILNSPPTGSRVDDGRRVDTWTMYDSIGRSQVRAEKIQDRRRRRAAKFSFGFPADENGNIADAPATPTRGPSENPRWRQDPNYFVMQEYGDELFDVSYPGMFAQEEGRREFISKFESEMKRKGYK